MPQPLSLSRAARLAGVSRGELQRRIRKDGVETFEGSIREETLLQLYPNLDLDHDPVLERLEKLKTNAQPKSRYSDGWLPEPEVLISRLHELNRVLVRTKTALNRADRLLARIRARLRQGDCDAVEEVQSWINQALERPEAELDPSAQLFVKDMFLKVMTAGVRVEPSGHEYFVEGNESILEAGLKAGLHLDYGCSSGNCGSCRAQVTEGEVQQVKDHDFVLSQRERDRGDILTCCWTAVTDVVLEAHEASSAQELPPQQVRTKVTKVEPAADDLAVLHLKTPRTQTLRFMAGQTARLSDEEGNSGAYPIASCPCDGRNLEFHIRAKAGDAFADTVLSRRIKSQVVTLDGPSGDFVLQEDSTRPAVFVAFGAGFAPVKSLVEHAISIDHAEHIYLYRVDRPLSASRIDNICRAWNDSLDNFSFTLLEHDLPIEQIAEHLAGDIPSPDLCDLYLAGPSEQLESLANAAKIKGFNPERTLTTPVS